MKKTTAKAPANIAFIKYWGKKNPALRLPLNSSISMNLGNVFTVTTVEFLANLDNDQINMIGEKLGDKETQRIISHLDRVRKLADIKLKAKVKTKNNFPKGSGIASSASGFAALTLAAVKATGLNLSQKELSILARLGSGSACRSIPDGFAEWIEGCSSKTSYAHSLYPPNYWKLADVIVLVTKKEKKVSSTEGHQQSKDNPFLTVRIKGMRAKIKKVKRALKNKNFTLLGETIEAEALNMHAVMMSSMPPILYWSPETIKVILAVQQWREEGLEAYFTIDAGATVHIICQQKDLNRLKKKISSIQGVDKIIVSLPGKGARFSTAHLF